MESHERRSAPLARATATARRPLPLAVAHNGGAAVLLLALVRINHGLTRVRVLRPMEENRNANAYA